MLAVADANKMCQSYLHQKNEHAGTWLTKYKMLVNEIT